MNWLNIGMIQWLIKERIKRHLSDAAELIKSFTSYCIVADVMCFKWCMVQFRGKSLGISPSGQA